VRLPAANVDRPDPVGSERAPIAPRRDRRTAATVAA
jgi:hypothetical protein